MILEANCKLELPGGAVVRAGRQPASTDRLTRAGLVGTANAHLFFLDGEHELPLTAALVMVAKRQGRVITDLPVAERRTFEVRDVDAWDRHTEVLTVERSASGTTLVTETWTRIRFIPNGLTKPSGAQDGADDYTDVELSFVGERGDAVGDRTLVSAEVVAAAGTLQENDGLSHPVRGFYEVRNVIPEGDWERAVLQG